VFERTVLQEQLRSLKRRLGEETRSLGDFVDGFLDEPPSPESSVGGLTRREQEVFRHLASGETNAEIAAKLYVSPGTVKCHVKSVLRKLGAANRAEAVAKYHQLATA
jgi:DNA-binding NarL/FixJ family response regulator